MAKKKNKSKSGKKGVEKAAKKKASSRKRAKAEAEAVPAGEGMPAHALLAAQRSTALRSESLEIVRSVDRSILLAWFVAIAAWTWILMQRENEGWISAPLATISWVPVASGLALSWRTWALRKTYDEIWGFLEAESHSGAGVLQAPRGLATLGGSSPLGLWRSAALHLAAGTSAVAAVVTTTVHAVSEAPIS